ncbi:hypothetical protein TNCV_2217801 [Trichonephila clavipes]|nr:hypothetical protein TNCV_2217801 [Trichonephila clavipes]
MSSMVTQRLTHITPSAATQDRIWQRVEATWPAEPQEDILSLFESMPRRVTVATVAKFMDQRNSDGEEQTKLEDIPKEVRGEEY